MGFWRGVAEGFKDAEASRERQMERDYRAAQDEKMDKRYADQIAYRDERDALADERYDREYNDRKSAAEWEKQWKISTTLGTLGGKTGGIGGGKGTSKSGTTAAQEAAAATLDLRDRVKDADLDKTAAAYFEEILADPIAAKGVLEFMDEQDKAGSPIDLNDLPNIIKILGQSEGMTKEEFDTLINETDWGDPEAMRQGLAKASVGLKRLITSTPRMVEGDAQDMSQQWELLEERVLESAIIESDRGNAELRNQVNLYYQSSDPVEKQRAKTRIMQRMLTPEYISALEEEPVFRNLGQNTRVKPYVTATPTSSIAPTAPTGGMSTAESASMAMTERAGQTTTGQALGEPPVAPSEFSGVDTPEAPMALPTPAVEAPAPEMDEEQATVTISQILGAREREWFKQYQAGKFTPEQIVAFEAKVGVPPGSFVSHMENIARGLEGGFDEFAGVDTSTDGLKHDSVTDLKRFFDEPRAKNEPVEDAPSEFSGVDGTDGVARDIISELKDALMRSRAKNKEDGPAKDAPSEFDETSLSSDKEDEIDILIRKTEEYLKDSRAKAKGENPKMVSEFDGVDQPKQEADVNIADTISDDEVRSITQTILRQDVGTYNDLLETYTEQELEEIVKKGMSLLYG